MKRAGRATIFEIGDMIGGEGEASSALMPTTNGTLMSVCVRAVPLPFYDGLFARIRAAWEIICGHAYPVKWPEPGDLELKLHGPVKRPPLDMPRQVQRGERVGY